MQTAVAALKVNAEQAKLSQGLLTGIREEEAAKVPEPIVEVVPASGRRADRHPDPGRGVPLQR